MTESRQLGRSGPVLALFAALYALQGVVVAYLTNFNKSYMMAAGVAADTAGWVETAALSWLIFKFVLGPISDKHSLLGLGHRKPYIVLGLILLAGGLAGMTFLHPGRMHFAYAASAVVAVAGMCLFDTTCDGFVIDVTAPEDRSRVQGLLQLSRFLATMVCTLGFGFWIHRTGPGPGRSDGVILACAGFAAVPLILAFLVREPKIEQTEEFRWSAFRVMLRRRSVMLLLFGALYGLVGLGVEFNLNLWYRELGFGSDGVGGLGAVRYAGRAAGAILLPILGVRLSKLHRISAGIALLAISTAAQGFVASTASCSVWAFLFGLANGWNDALFCVLAMELSDPALAASTYAIYMAAANVSIVGDALFLELAQNAPGGFPTAFYGCGVLVAALLGFAPSLAADERKPVPAEVSS